MSTLSSYFTQLHLHESILRKLEPSSERPISSRRNKAKLQIETQKNSKCGSLGIPILSSSSLCTPKLINHQKSFFPPKIVSHQNTLPASKLCSNKVVSPHPKIRNKKLYPNKSCEEVLPQINIASEVFEKQNELRPETESVCLKKRKSEEERAILVEEEFHKDDFNIPIQPSIYVKNLIALQRLTDQITQKNHKEFPSVKDISLKGPKKQNTANSSLMPPRRTVSGIPKKALVGPKPSTESKCIIISKGKRLLIKNISRLSLTRAKLDHFRSMCNLTSSAEISPQSPEIQHNSDSNIDRLSTPSSEERDNIDLNYVQKPSTTLSEFTTFVPIPSVSQEMKQWRHMNECINFHLNLRKPAPPLNLTPHSPPKTTYQKIQQVKLSRPRFLKLKVRNPKPNKTPLIKTKFDEESENDQSQTIQAQSSVLHP